MTGVSVIKSLHLIPLYQAVELIDKGLVDPTVLTEAVIDYENFAEAIEMASKPDTYKVILKFGE